MKKPAAGIKLTGVPRTMIWTLQPRAEEHSRPGGLFKDEIARSWFSQIASIEDTSAWYSPAYQTAIAIRTRVMDDATRRFIAEHEHPLVVEMGAGLSTRPYRIGLTRAEWMMLDLPVVIQLRQRLETETIPTIACSVLDDGWMDQLPQRAPNDILFIAEGLLIYFSKAECKRLVGRMQARFPGAKFLLDMAGQLARTGEIQCARSMGISTKWLIHDEREVAALGLEIIDVWPFLEQYPERLKSVFGNDWQGSGSRNISLIIEAQISPCNEMNSEVPKLAEPAAHEAQSPDAIRFRDQYYTAKKTFLDGQHRIRPPEETLTHLRPCLEKAGITRVADITGLDRIGIPVVLVTRPNAPTSRIRLARAVHWWQPWFRASWKALRSIMQRTPVCPSFSCHTIC